MITSKGIEFKADGSQQRQCVYDVKHSSSLCTAHAQAVQQQRRYCANACRYGRQSRNASVTWTSGPCTPYCQANVVKNGTGLFQRTGLY